jgi:hypothetical protein
MQWLQLVGYVKQCVLQHLEVLNPPFIMIFFQQEKTINLMYFMVRFKTLNLQIKEKKDQKEKCT